MLPRLQELEDDLTARRARAVAERWLGEIEGIDLTLRFLADKRAQAQRLVRVNGPTQLGMRCCGELKEAETLRGLSAFTQPAPR